MKILKAGIFIVLLIISIFSPQIAHSIGFEISGGFWLEWPSGDLEYGGISLNTDNDLNFDSAFKFYGRAKLYLLIIPDIYIMYTPIEFKGTGKTDKSFRLNEKKIATGTEFDSELKLNQYDLALYYSIPGLELATADTINIDIGIDARIINSYNKITQLSDSVSESSTELLPMIYGSLQVSMPTTSFGFEAEVRSNFYSRKHNYDVILKGRYNITEQLFFGFGYRYQKVRIEIDDIETDLTVYGPFGEVGVEFL